MNCSLAASREPIPSVVRQHAVEAAVLRHTRSVLVDAPHAKLENLAGLDERIAAHLDGLAVAGEYGSAICEEALETPGVGEAFAATVRAIGVKDGARLDKLFTLAEMLPDVRHGLASGFGWVSAFDLRGTVAELLAAKDPIRQEVGIVDDVGQAVPLPSFPIEGFQGGRDPADEACPESASFQNGLCDGSRCPLLRHAVIVIAATREFACVVEKAGEICRARVESFGFSQAAGQTRHEPAVLPEMAPRSLVRSRRAASPARFIPALRPSEERPRLRRRRFVFATVHCIMPICRRSRRFSGNRAHYTRWGKSKRRDGSAVG